MIRGMIGGKGDGMSLRMAYEVEELRKKGYDVHVNYKIDSLFTSIKKYSNKTKQVFVYDERGSRAEGDDVITDGDMIMCDQCKTTTHENLVKNQEVEPRKGKLAIDLWSFVLYWHREGNCLRFPSKGQDNRWEYLESMWKIEKKSIKIFITIKALIATIKVLIKKSLKKDYLNLMNKR